MTYSCRGLRDILTMIERKRDENRQINWDFVHIAAEGVGNCPLFSKSV